MTETEFQFQSTAATDAPRLLVAPEGTATQPASTPTGARQGRCPFHDGPETLDGLLAEIGLEDATLMDCALDLRCLIQARQDARACFAQLCRLRAQLDGKHYLAFYRIRRWMKRLLAMESSPGRNVPWVRHELPLDCARPDEAEYQCLARWPADTHGCLSTGARVRFVFAE
ncbi:hypothetical protein OpiT1DRAFT_05050 [Opitutaceae bacterium TAV1]|nr:hypothetical protein OpiT1DRAFT_05050 [Opitutaceae bacterium TAV1]